MGVTKSQIPTKHRTKKINQAQDEAIRQLQQEKGYASYMQAKHHFFENIAGEKVAEDASAKKAAKPASEAKPCMTIEQTKLGVTMVISKDDCKSLGFKPSQTTKEVLQNIRSKLGLAIKGQSFSR